MHPGIAEQHQPLLRSPRQVGWSSSDNMAGKKGTGRLNWVAFEELNLSYIIGETK